MRIMIVDDQVIARKVLQTQVRNLGFHDVISCSSGAEALHLIEADPLGIGIVICDLQMPEMDGVEVLRHLARLRYVGGVVILSAESGRVLHTAERLARAHGLNILAAVEKPVTPSVLARILPAQVVQSVSDQVRVRRVYGADDLRAAIDQGDLVNVYQPKVTLATGQVAGVETLVRWQHPDNGMVYPDEFIGLAEEHGLINALTQRVLTSAVAQASAWRAAGLDLSVAVNVSMDDLTDLAFPEMVARVGAAHGVPLSSLVLEVTESRLMKDARGPLDILTRLRLKRVRLSIDDFGTGHSSLAQLRDFPFDELKIDRGFVHGACHDSALRAIFDGSCHMARELGMKVVAEGVEDAEDWEFLRRSHCDLAQGYFIARPMPGGEVQGWVERWRAPP